MSNEPLTTIDNQYYPLTGDADLDEMLRMVIETRRTKGQEYTVGSQDILANFRQVAQEVGVPMETAWYIFFNKHVRAIASYIKSGRKVHSNEPISSRIMDCIVYLLLFYKMVVEFERADQFLEDNAELMQALATPPPPNTLTGTGMCEIKCPQCQRVRMRGTMCVCSFGWPRDSEGGHI